MDFEGVKEVLSLALTSDLFGNSSSGLTPSGSLSSEISVFVSFLTSSPLSA